MLNKYWKRPGNGPRILPENALLQKHFSNRIVLFISSHYYYVYVKQRFDLKKFEYSYSEDRTPHTIRLHHDTSISFKGFWACSKTWLISTNILLYFLSIFLSYVNNILVPSVLEFHSTYLKRSRLLYYV